MPNSHQAMTTKEFVSKEVFKSHNSPQRDIRTRRNDLQTKFWKVIPNIGACEACQVMGEGVHWEKPERPHPNCKCEIISDTIRVHIYKQLQGWRDAVFETFPAGQGVNVTIKSLGPKIGGVYMTADGSEKRSTGHMKPGSSATFRFTKFGEIPLTWRIEFISDASDGCTSTYRIWN